MTTMISIAKANKVRNLLKSKVLVSIEAKIFIAKEVTFVGFETSEKIAERIAACGLEVETLLVQRDGVVKAISALRRIIATANFNFEVDSIMNAIKVNTDELKFFRGLRMDISDFKTAEQIDAEMKYGIAEAANTSSPYSRPHVNKTFSALSEKTVKSVNEMVDTLEATIRTLEEKRNEVNYSNTVSLDEELVKVLETYKLL